MDSFTNLPANYMIHLAFEIDVGFHTTSRQTSIVSFRVHQSINSPVDRSLSRVVKTQCELSPLASRFHVCHVTGSASLTLRNAFSDSHAIVSRLQELWRQTKTRREESAARECGHFAKLLHTQLILLTENSKMPVHFTVVAETGPMLSSVMLNLLDCQHSGHRNNGSLTESNSLIMNFSCMPAG